MNKNTETFKRWWMLQLITYDCDPALYVMRYLIERYELNREQRYWLCWLYANTYHLPTAWVLFNEFPDYENVCHGTLSAFNAVHAQRLPYQKDQKWLRGKLGETFASYRAMLGKASQHDWFTGMDTGIHPTVTFLTTWNIAKKELKGFGRYTLWFYFQALHEICDWNVEPTHMFLGDSSSKQPREGLLKALDWTEGPTVELDRRALEILAEIPPIMKDKGWPIRANLFSMETALCSFSKLGRGAPKGRYLGYYLDRFAMDIEATAKHDWWGINWDALWEARDEILIPQMNFRAVRTEEMDMFPLMGEFNSDHHLLSKLDHLYLSNLSL